MSGVDLIEALVHSFFNDRLFAFELLFPSALQVFLKLLIRHSRLHYLLHFVLCVLNDFVRTLLLCLEQLNAVVESHDI